MVDLQAGFIGARQLILCDAERELTLAELDALCIRALRELGLATHWCVGVLRREPMALDIDVDATHARMIQWQ